MKTVTQRAYARAGLLGNPSDGYHGKTISLIVRNFFAEVSLSESDQISLVPAPGEELSFDSIYQLKTQIDECGYYGGIRLAKAAIKRFCEYCQVTDQSLHDQNFSVSYSTNIPRQAGLAGSSAIVTAMLRSLMRWYDIEIHPHFLASLALSAELELGIPAGLQDRVIQAYEGVVYMDFDKSKMKNEHGLEFGVYEQLDPESLPKLYVAYTANAGEPTEILHNDLRQRFEQGDQAVIDAMKKFAAIAEQGVGVMQRGDARELGSLIDKNFDLRDQICMLHPEHKKMIQAARGVGASAKYCGSGGAIIGTFENDEMLANLVSAMNRIQCLVLRPQIAES